MRQQPLWQRIFHDPIYTALVRMIRYDTWTYCDLVTRLEPLEVKYDKERVHSAAYFLVSYEGQDTCNPKPLAPVRLRPEAAKAAAGLIGPAPGTPEYEYFKSEKPWVPPWQLPTEPKPKGTTLPELPEEQLRSRLEEAEKKLSTVSTRSKGGKELKREITAIGQELRSRTPAT